MSKIRLQIAMVFARARMFRAFCFVRGNHLALKQVGRCLSCGKTEAFEPKARVVPIINSPRAVAANDADGRRAAFVRNAIVRNRARRDYLKGDVL